MNFLVNCSKGTMLIESNEASSMIKTGEKVFKLDQVREENVV